MSATNRGSEREKDDFYVIHTANCLDVLRTLPDCSVDAIITDPPYGTASPSKVQKCGEELTSFNLEWDATLPVDWLGDAARLLVPGGSLMVFTDNNQVTDLWRALEAVGLNPLQTVTWVKSNPPPQPRKNFCSGIETAIFARKPGKVHRWNGGGATVNFFECPIVSANRLHPTQKPEQLMSWLVSLVSDPGDTILDPFSGSGTTGAVAIQLGRDFIGIEKDATFAALARDRLAAVAAQGDLLHSSRLEQFPTVHVIDIEDCK